MNKLRKALRVLIVPVALVVLVVGTSLPASANDADPAYAPAYSDGLTLPGFGPLSLNW